MSPWGARGRSTLLAPLVFSAPALKDRRAPSGPWPLSSAGGRRRAARVLPLNVRLRREVAVHAGREPGDPRVLLWSRIRSNGGEGRLGRPPERPESWDRRGGSQGPP